MAQRDDLNKVLAYLPDRYKKAYAQGKLEDEDLLDYGRRHGLLQEATAVAASAPVADFSNVEGRSDTVAARPENLDDPGLLRTLGRDSLVNLLGENVGGTIADETGNVYNSVVGGAKRSLGAGMFTAEESGNPLLSEALGNLFDTFNLEGGGSIAGALRRVTDSGSTPGERGLDLFKQGSDEVQRTTEFAQNESALPAWLATAASDVGSTPSSLASVVGGGPTAVVPGADVFAQEYTSARLAGLSKDEATKRASAQAAIELGVESIPASTLLKRIPIIRDVADKVIAGELSHDALKFVSKLGMTSAGEGVEEGVTTNLQFGTDALLEKTGNEREQRFAQANLPKDLVDYFNQTMRSTLAGAVGGAGIGGHSAWMEVAAERGRLANNMITGQVSSELDLDAQRKKAQDAAADKVRGNQLELFGTPDSDLPSFNEQDAARIQQLAADALAQINKRGDIDSAFEQNNRRISLDRSAAIGQSEGNVMADAFARSGLTDKLAAIPAKTQTKAPAQTVAEPTQQNLPLNTPAQPNELAKAEDENKKFVVRKMIEDDEKAITNKAKSTLAAERRKAAKAVVEHSRTIENPDERVQFVQDAMDKWDAENTLDQHVATVRKTMSPTTKQLTKKKAVPTPAPKVADEIPVGDEDNSPIRPGEKIKSRDELAKIYGVKQQGSSVTSDLKTDDVIDTIGRKMRTGDAKVVAKLIADKNLVVVDDASHIPSNGVKLGDTAGFYDGKRTYVVANQLNKDNVMGDLLSVAAHEVHHAANLSGKVTLTGFVGKTDTSRLRSKIEKLAENGNPVARMAVNGAKQTPDHYEDELLAYFINGARETRGGLAKSVLRDVVSAVRTNAKKFYGTDLDVNPDDVAYLSDKLLKAAATKGERLTADVNGGLEMIGGKKATGFKDAKNKYFSVDGNQKFQFSDKGAKLTDGAISKLQESGGFPSLNLKDILAHDELYKQYPEARDITVTTNKILGGGAGERAAFINLGKTKLIYINPLGLTEPDKVRSSLLHEIQHFVQEQEGHAYGSSPYMFTDEGLKLLESDLDRAEARFNELLGMAKRRPEMDDLVSQIDRTVTKREFMDAAAERLKGDGGKATVGGAAWLSDQIRKNLVSADNLASAVHEGRRIAFGKYQDTLGELEARYTESNMFKDLDELPANPEENFDNNKPADKALIVDRAGVVLGRADEVGGGTKARLAQALNSRRSATAASGPVKLTGPDRSPGRADLMLDELDNNSAPNPLDDRERVVLDENGNAVAAVELTRRDPTRVRVNSIRSFEKGKGAGRKALEQLTKLADKHNVTVELSADPFGKDGLSKKQLEDWYARHGFEHEGVDGYGDMVRVAETKENILAKIANTEFSLNYGRRSLAQLERQKADGTYPDPDLLDYQIEGAKELNDKDEAKLAELKKRLGQVGLAFNVNDFRKAMANVKAPDNKAVRFLKSQIDYKGGLGKQLNELREDSVGSAALYAHRGMNAFGRINSAVNTVAAQAVKAGRYKTMDQATTTIKQTINANLDRIAGIEGEDRRASAMAAWVRENPQYRPVSDAINEINQLSKTLLGQMLIANPDPTPAQLRLMNTIHDNMFRYATRMYAAFQGDAGRDHSRLMIRQYNAAREALAKNKNVPEKFKRDFEIYTNAMKYIVDHDLIIPDRDGLEALSTEKLGWLYDTWVGNTRETKQKARAMAEGEGMNKPMADQAVRETMIEALERRRDSVTEAQLEGKADDLIKGMLGLHESASPFATFYRGFTQDRTILEHREHLPQEIRDLFGEIKDPAVRLAVTIAKQGELAARTRLLLDMREQGTGKWVVPPEEAGLPGNEDFTVTLKGKNYGPLNGWRTTKQISTAIGSSLELYSSLTDALAKSYVNTDAPLQALGRAGLQGIKTLAGWQKLLSVVWDFFNIGMNFGGSVFQAIGNGVYNPKHYKAGGRVALDVIADSMFDNAGRLNPVYEDAIKYGLLDSARVQEIRATPQRVIRDMISDESRVYRHSKSITRRGIHSMTEMFAMSDAWTKVASWQQRVDHLTKFYKAESIEKTEDAIKREAADQMKNTNITYARTPPAIRTVESVGLTTFMPYFYSVPRVIAHNYILGTKDLVNAAHAKSDKGKLLMLQSGIGRIAGSTAATYGLTFVLKSIAAAANDDDEAVEEMKKMMNTDARFADSIYLGKDGSGVPLFFRLSRVDPYGPVNDILRVYMNDDLKPDEKSRYALQMLGGLVFSNRVTQALIKSGASALPNVDINVQSRSRLERLAPGTAEAAKDVLTSLPRVDLQDANNVLSFLDSLTPGIVDAVDPTNVVPKEVRGNDPWLRFLGQMAVVSGGRLDRADPKMAAFVAGKEVDQARKDGRKRMADGFNAGSSPDVLLRRYMEAANDEYLAMQQVNNVYEGMTRGLGMTPRQASDILKDGTKLTATDIAGLRTGRINQEAEQWIRESSRILSESSIKQRDESNQRTLSPEEVKEREKSLKEFLKQMKAMGLKVNKEGK